MTSSARFENEDVAMANEKIPIKKTKTSRTLQPVGHCQKLVGGLSRRYVVVLDCGVGVSAVGGKLVRSVRRGVW